MRRLVIAIDAAAVLRDSAGPAAADLGAVATLARLAGADAIQIGVSEENQARREPEVRDLRRAVPALELRLTPAPGLLKLALETQPQRVVFCTEAARGNSGGGPLDFRAWGTALPPAARTLREAGIAVAARIEPELEAVKAAHAADVQAVDLDVTAAQGAVDGRSASERLGDASRFAAKLRLGVGLAGGLEIDDLRELLAAAAPVERICVGRAFCARALLVGIDRAVRDLRDRLA